MQQVAQGLASLGRGDDKMLVHMTPREVAGLQSLAMAHGGSLTINPHTGLPEAGILDSIMPTVLGAGAMLIPGMQPLAAAALVGGGYGLATGSLRKGLMAGLGAYGGAGIGQGLANMGELAAQQTAEQQATAAAQKAAAEAVPNEISRLASSNPESLIGQPGGMSVSDYQKLVANTGGYESMGQNLVPASQLQQSAADYAVNQLPNSLPSTAENMYQGAQQLGTKQGWKDLYNQPGVGLTGLTAAFAQPALAAITPKPVQIPTATVSKPNYPNYSFKQTRNPNWGQPGESYYKQEYVPMAAGGQVPNPNEFYPGANIPRSTYAMSTQAPMPQSVVGDYDAPINPFTGETNIGASTPRYMASGGLAHYDLGGTIKSLFMGDLKGSGEGLGVALRNVMGQIDAQGGFDRYGSPAGYTYDSQAQQYIPRMASGGLADFKMYSDKNEISNVEDLTPSQLEAAADSDDPYLMGIASLERDRRKGSGTKGYKRREFAAGGMAAMPEYAAGGKLLRGPGDGMSDDIPAVIKGQKPQRAALADGEFVVPADVVSHLGNGSTDAGAKRLYAMMDKVRTARTGRKAQGRQIKAERFLPA
jgi:hypothetical protein